MSRSVDPVAKHRRDVWLYLILPVVLTAAILLVTLVILFVLAVAGTLSAEQINVISSIMLMVCILIPLVLVAIGVNVAMIFVAWGSWKLPTTITPPLRSIRRMVENIAVATPKVMSHITNPLIAIHARWTRWEYFMRGILGIQDKSVDSKHDLEATKHE